MYVSTSNNEPEKEVKLKLDCRARFRIDKTEDLKSMKKFPAAGDRIVTPRQAQSALHHHTATLVINRAWSLQSGDTDIVLY